jgi:hypothetical protein
VVSNIRTKQKKALDGKAPEPASLLGYANPGELFEIIRYSKNHLLFFPHYFRSPSELEVRMRGILGLRVSVSHAEEREVRVFPYAVEPLVDMAYIADAYDPSTSQRIREVYESVASGPPAPAKEVLVRDRILTNISDFQNPMLSGRLEELKVMKRFWEDPFARVLSVSGAGGVGKTALINQFIANILECAYTPDSDPDPVALVYLTAKNNYLPKIHREDPTSMRFDNLQKVFATMLALGMDGSNDFDGTSSEGRRRCLEIAEVFRVLFVFDNMETLAPDASEEMQEFISMVPRPSKVIMTSRVERETGTPLRLKGLPEADALALLGRRLELHGDALEHHDVAEIRQIIRYSDGFPLTLVQCANLIGSYQYSATEALDKIRGSTMLDFLRFSFESSINQLDDVAFRVLAAISMVAGGTSRKRLERVAGRQDVLDDAVVALTAINFIERVPDQKKTASFRIASEQLRDFVNAEARRRLPDRVYAGLGGADERIILPRSDSVEFEIERALQDAEVAAEQGWAAAVETLEGAVAKWGDDARLLSKLGYFHFRMLNRKRARTCLERAIELGSDAPNTFTTLALVMFHERDYAQGQRHAEIALALEPGSRVAQLILAECLISSAERGRFTFAAARRRQMYERALRNAQDSLILDERTFGDGHHNQQARQWIARAEEGIRALGDA